MLNLPLAIRPAQESQRDAVAWLIPGDQPRRWLDELSDWRVPMVDLKLYLIPTSPTDLRPQAVLAVPPGGMEPQVSRRCQPYGRHAGRLYLPTRARFDPPMADRELASLLGENVYVMHPALGPIVFEEADVLRPVDLLQRPVLDPVDWGCAQPATAINDRLRSIMPTQQFEIDQMLLEGRDDIGTERPTKESLPPSPNEPAEGMIAKTARGIQRGFAHFVRLIAASEKIQPGADSRSRVSGLENWADRQLQRLDRTLENLRNREINRLMHMLETDPDEGLRFAIKAGGDAHRGLAQPSARLAPSRVDFSMRGIQGGGPADCWDIPHSVQLRLTARYRELAERELRLGRHRRAAYIYAELLGELPMAAAALKQGRYFREAALLYRDKLQQPHQAALCLEEGGLLGEAIEEYEKISEFEKAGDLYRQLEQMEDAERSYRKVVDECLRSDNILKAAELLDKKIEAIDEALRALDRAWPGSRQAAACLKESFAVRARLGRHDQTHQKIAVLQEISHRMDQSVLLVGILASQATKYPDAKVRLLAADATRVVAGRTIPIATPRQTDQILHAVGQLVPEDRLLGRDCRRYSSQQTRLATRKQVARSTSRRNQPRLLTQFQLPEGFDWQTAISIGKTFYALGYEREGRGGMLVRGNWDGDCQTLTFVRENISYESGQTLHADSDESHPLLILPGNGISAGSSGFPPSDPFPTKTRVSAASCISHHPMGIAIGSDGVIWEYAESNSGYLLCSLGRDGNLLATRQLQVSSDLNRNARFPVPMVAGLNKVYLGLAHQLMIVDSKNEPHLVEQPKKILSLTASIAFSRMQIAATFERGGAVYWDGYGVDYWEPFAWEVENPRVCFIAGGTLVAAGDGECQFYASQSIEPTLKIQGRMPNSDRSPVAVMPTGHRSTFALCSAVGTISVYDIPFGAS